MGTYVWELRACDEGRQVLGKAYIIRLGIFSLVYKNNRLWREELGHNTIVRSPSVVCQWPNPGSEILTCVQKVKCHIIIV